MGKRRLIQELKWRYIFKERDNVLYYHFISTSKQMSNSGARPKWPDRKAIVMF
jgi:hypothetical protein